MTWCTGERPENDELRPMRFYIRTRTTTGATAFETLDAAVHQARAVIKTSDLLVSRRTRYDPLVAGATDERTRTNGAAAASDARR
jgi:hypothetical protein